VSLTFLDVPTALRRFDAISVGDASFTPGVTVGGRVLCADRAVRPVAWSKYRRSYVEHLLLARGDWESQERREHREGERQ
jgi:hypothetical protein